jgi:hypothetical protein
LIAEAAKPIMDFTSGRLLLQYNHDVPREMGMKSVEYGFVNPNADHPSVVTITPAMRTERGHGNVPSALAAKISGKGVSQKAGVQSMKDIVKIMMYCVHLQSQVSNPLYQTWHRSQPLH